MYLPLSSHQSSTSWNQHNDVSGTNMPAIFPTVTTTDISSIIYKLPKIHIHIQSPYTYIYLSYIHIFIYDDYLIHKIITAGTISQN